MFKFLTIFLLSVTACLISVSALAQGQDADEISSEDMQYLTTDKIPIRQATETTGTPYLFESFNEGSITLTNNRVTGVLPIRYNIYEQTLEFMEDNTAFKMDPSQIKEFDLHVDNAIYTFRKGYDARRLSEDDFVRLIIDDEVKFIAKHTVSFQQGVASYGTATQKDEYIPDVTYYIKVGDGNVNRIRSLSKRRIMRNIDHHENEVDKYASNNNLDFSNPDDVEDLLLHYNSLLTKTD